MSDKVWARIENSAVAEVVTLDASLTPGIDVFTPDMTFVDATGVIGVARGWAYVNGSFAAPPVVPETPAQLLQYLSNKQNTLLKRIWTFDLGTADAPVKCTTRLDGGGSLSMMKLIIWGQTYASVDGASEAYSNVDYTPVTLTPAQAEKLGLAGGAIESQTYALLTSLSAGILAMPPTITTQAEIDAAAWPTPAT